MVLSGTAAADILDPNSHADDSAAPAVAFTTTIKSHADASSDSAGQHVAEDSSTSVADDAECIKMTLTGDTDAATIQAELSTAPALGKHSAVTTSISSVLKKVRRGAFERKPSANVSDVRNQSVLAAADVLGEKANDNGLIKGLASGYVSSAAVDVDSQVAGAAPGRSITKCLKMLVPAGGAGAQDINQAEATESIIDKGKNGRGNGCFVKRGAKGKDFSGDDDHQAAAVTASGERQQWSGQSIGQHGAAAQATVAEPANKGSEVAVAKPRCQPNFINKIYHLFKHCGNGADGGVSGLNGSISPASLNRVLDMLCPKHREIIDFGAGDGRVLVSAAFAGATQATGYELPDNKAHRFLLNAVLEALESESCIPADQPEASCVSLRSCVKWIAKDIDTVEMLPGRPSCAYR